MYSQARYSICLGFCPNRKLIGHAQYDVYLKLETFLITYSVLKAVTHFYANYCMTERVAIFCRSHAYHRDSLLLLKLNKIVHNLRASFIL